MSAVSKTVTSPLAGMYILWPAPRCGITSACTKGQQATSNVFNERERQPSAGYPIIARPPEPSDRNLSGASVQSRCALPVGRDASAPWLIDSPSVRQPSTARAHARPLPG